MGKARDYIPALQFGHKIYPQDLAFGSGLFGDVYYVDYANGTDSNNAGTTPDKPLKTLTKAHELVTTNNGDTIFVNGTTGVHVQEPAMLTWSKNRVSVVGIGPAGAVDPQPEIQLTSSANSDANAATIKVTGYGNSFTNIYISNSGTDGASVASLWDAGENTIYTNCQFAKFSDLNETAVSDVEARGDATTWRNCRFGVDWVLQTVNRPTLLIKGTGGGARMKRNVFEDCYFECQSTEEDKNFIKVYDNNSIAFTNTWKDCVFTAAVMAFQSAVNLVNTVESSSGLITGELHFINPSSNSDNFCSIDNSGIVDGVIVNGPGAATQAAYIGVGVNAS